MKVPNYLYLDDRFKGLDYNSIIENLRANLKYLRMRKRVTKTKAARDLGQSLNSYSKYEEGVKLPQRIETLERLAEYYNVDIKKLIGNKYLR